MVFMFFALCLYDSNRSSFDSPSSAPGRSGKAAATVGQGEELQGNDHGSEAKKANAGLKKVHVLLRFW